MTLRAPSITKLAATVVSASHASAAAGHASSDVAILDSGATHHLWPTYKAFISYSRVHGQHVTLADNSVIRIAGRGAITIMMGGKKLVIRDVYHVPGLRIPCSVSAFTGACPGVDTTVTTPTSAASSPPSN